MQNKLQSLFECFINIMVGYWVAVGAAWLIFPHFGIKVNLEENMAIAAFFTIISIIRSYILRRFFNWYHGAVNEARAKQLAAVANERAISLDLQRD